MNISHNDKPGRVPREQEQGVDSAAGSAVSATVGAANPEAAVDSVMAVAAADSRLKTSAGAGDVTVMVIDDSKTIRRSAENLLQKEGWSVVTAIDGFDALAKVVEHEPDIVLADIMMPRLDGYQTCALIKNNDRYNKTPVIMLSSKDSIFDKARGRVVGSEHYLTKPFSREDLVNAVRKHLPGNIGDAVQSC